MKYSISRTSDLMGKYKPCENAYKGVINFAGQQIWHVDINTLEELHLLQDAVDEDLIVGDGYIEIYDAEREGV